MCPFKINFHLFLVVRGPREDSVGACACTKVGYHRPEVSLRTRFTRTFTPVRRPKVPVRPITTNNHYKFSTHSLNLSRRPHGCRTVLKGLCPTPTETSKKYIQRERFHYKLLLTLYLFTYLLTHLLTRPYTHSSCHPTHQIDSKGI